MKFKPNEPIETATPTLKVDPGMAPGPYRFRLVVENKRGLQSNPVETVVTILPG